MRTAAATALACLAVAAAAGCGSQGDSTPAACLEGQAAFLSALRSAPGPVEVGGETPISDCLAQNQTAGDLASVGGTLVEAATALNAKARTDPAGPAALELGYLVGAAQKGAEKTEGIHADLMRRLFVAARFAPDVEPLSPRLRAGYAEGFDAGVQHG